jgi:hypothetical protein
MVIFGRVRFQHGMANVGRLRTVWPSVAMAVCRPAGFRWCQGDSCAEAISTSLMLAQHFILLTEIVADGSGPLG